jgi:hypothetical protein
MKTIIKKMMKLTTANVPTNICCKKTISGLFTVVTLLTVLVGNSSFISEGIGQTLEKTSIAIIEMLPTGEEITAVKISAPSRSMIRKADREIHLNMNEMIKELNSFHLVMNENKTFSQAKPPSHSNVFDATGSMLDAMKSLEAKNNPGHIAYTKNGSTNPFTLNEALTKQNKRDQQARDFVDNQPGLGTPDAPTMPANGWLISADDKKGINAKTTPMLGAGGTLLDPAINAQREENRFNSRPDRYVPMGELRSGVAGTGAVIPSLSQQANAPQAPYQPAVPYEQQTDRPTPARTDRLPVKTPGAPAPTSAAPGTAPATPAPRTATPGTSPTTPAPTGTAPPSPVPGKNTPYVRTYTSSEPTSTNAPNDNTYLPNRPREP